MKYIRELLIIKRNNEFLFEQGILLIIGKIIQEDNNKNENEKNLVKKDFIKISDIEIFINILTSILHTILEYLKKKEVHHLVKLLTNIMINSDNKILSIK